MATLLLLALQVADALKATRAEASYEVTFTSSTRIGRGDALDRKGTLLWWKAGVIIVDTEASGQQFTRAVRAGTQFACAKHPPVFASTPCESCASPRVPTSFPRVWVHELGAWTTADQSTNSGAASGFQNPDELLRLIESHVESARSVKGGWEIALKGAEALKAANKLEPGRDFVARNAALSVFLKLDQGRVISLDVDAALATADGAATFTAAARLGRFGQAAVPAGLGTAKRPVPFSAEVTAAIAQQLR